MCGLHKTDADGPWDTLDGEVPESWLTVPELLAKWERRFEAGEVFLICNELKGDEIEVALQNVLAEGQRIAREGR